MAKKKNHTTKPIKGGTNTPKNNQGVKPSPVGGSVKAGAVKASIALLSLLLPGRAYAETLKVTHPTVDVLGNPISTTDIKNFQVYRNGSLLTTITPVPDVGVQDVPVTLSLGTNTMKARAVNQQNLVGPFSADFVLATNTPPPTATPTPTHTPLPAIGAPGLSQ